MINILRFDPRNAVLGHNGTILAQDVFPASVTNAPFQHRYGYMEANCQMAGHAHEKREVYMIIYGSGTILIGDETAHVETGDVIDIPSNQWHELFSDGSGPMLWAAFFWMPQK